MRSLVGDLVPRYVQSTENFATEALYYILQNSQTARLAFISHLSEFTPGLSEDLVFRTQAVGDDNAIPDLVGTDKTGRQIVIAEAKFWASLTDNQPTTYLKRLVPDHLGLLIFLVPEVRFRTLWPDLQRRCFPEGTVQHGTVLTKDRFCLQINHCHSLAMTSWRAVFGRLNARLAEAGEENIRADLRQLEGLCDREDSEAFLPIRSEEFSPSIGKRVVQYCKLIDDVVAQLASEGVASIKGLRTTASQAQWGRFMRIRGNGCLLYLFAHAWANYRETPLWLSVKDHNWCTTADLRSTLLPLEREVPPRLVVDSDGQLLVPLFLPTGVERGAVISSVAAQIGQVAALLPEHSSEPASEQAPEPGAAG